MLELGSSQNMTGMETKRAGLSALLNFLVYYYVHQELS